MKLDQLLTSLKTEGQNYFGLTMNDDFSRRYLSHPSGCHLSGHMDKGKARLFMNFSDLPVGTPIDLEDLPLSNIEHAWIVSISQKDQDLAGVINQILFSELALEPLSESNLNMLARSGQHPGEILFKANELLFDKKDLMDRLHKSCRRIKIHDQFPEMAQKLSGNFEGEISDKNSFHDDGTVSFHRMKKTRLSKKYIDTSDLDSFIEQIKEREQTRPKYDFLKKYFQVDL